MWTVKNMSVAYVEGLILKKKIGQLWLQKMPGNIIVHI